MKVAHLDLIGGAAGNMLLGAFIDAGVRLPDLENRLRGVIADGWTFSVSGVVKNGVAATFVDFLVPHERHGTKLGEVLEIVMRSSLTEWQKQRACAVYRRLGEAEALVHGTTIEAMHFHEVGAVDAILDVAGTVVALDLLGIERLTCSRVPVGSGSIRMQHGVYPNPPPGTAELLRGVPTFDAGIEAELVTPTAAALLTVLCDGFGTRPDMVVESIGYGAGTRDLALPNVTRLSVGSALGASGGAPDVRVLEANIDDMSSQHFELAIERIFAAGALDVWLAPISMKKGRPAILLSAIVPPLHEAACAETMLRETTTIGVRARSERRYVLERDVQSVHTPLGDVRVKDVRTNGRCRRMPEYDDVLRIAREWQRPLPDVAREVQAFLDAEPR